MKRILAAMGIALVGVTVSAQTNQVLSRNAVGYQRIDLPSSGFELVCNQFNQLDGSPSVLSNVLPAASNNTQVILWDQVAQQYVTITRTKGAWGTAGSGGTNPVDRTKGFFLRGPAGVSQTVYIMGEVPDRLTATQTVSYAIQGFNALGIGYPVSMAWTNTTLAQSLPNNDQIIIWSSAVTNYLTYTKSKNQWNDGTNLVLRAGQGFYIRKNSTGTNTWTQVKPYTWP